MERLRSVRRALPSRNLSDKRTVGMNPEELPRRGWTRQEYGVRHRPALPQGSLYFDGAGAAAFVIRTSLACFDVSSYFAET